MDLQLKDKSVIVTGGAKGIGLAITKAFLEEGARVCMVGTDERTLQEVRAQVGQPDRCIGIRCDVTKAAQIRDCIRTVEQTFGGVDILVNNAGVLKPARIEEMTEEQWDHDMAVNLKSTFLCTKEMIEPMKRRGGGVIINASSFAAQIPSVGQSVYAAAKSGVKSFTRVSAAELAPYNIRTFAYIPGVIKTQLVAPLIEDPQNAERMKNDIAAHRFGEPSEVASVVVFLASERAGYVSGTSIEVAGGKFCVQNPGKIYE